MRYKVKVYGHGAAVLGNKVYVVGGYHYTVDEHPVCVHNLASHSWRAWDAEASIPRGTTSACFGYQDKVYLYIFSLRELAYRFFALDVLLEEVREIILSGKADDGIGATGVWVESKGEVVLCGGRDQGSFTEISVFNLLSRKLRKPCIKGQKPVARYHAACCTDDQNLVYVCGGKVRHEVRHLDLHILSYNGRTSVMRWSSPKVNLSSRPRTRYLFSISLFGSRLLAYGGFPDHSCGKSMLVFSMKDGTWHSVSEEQDNKKYHLQAPSQWGTQEHAAVELNNRLLIFGGFGRRFNICRAMMISPLE